MKKIILYVGDDCSSSTSYHRAKAIERIGHTVIVLNPASFVGLRSKWRCRLDYITGYTLLQSKLLYSFKRYAASLDFSVDLIWVNGGELIGPRLLCWLKSHFCCPAVLYNNDDPTGNRDGNRFLSLKRSLRYFDLCVMCREETAIEAAALGALRGSRVMMSYDEHVHVRQALFPLAGNESVSFVGTYIPGEYRDRQLLEMIHAGIPIFIAGNLWNKSSLFFDLKSALYGTAITGTDYAKLIQTSAVSIGFLSHLNRDLVTRRTFEIPACGGLFCAERTSEHQLLFEDGIEAVFWDSVDECIAVCKELLADASRNYSIRTAGHHHMLAAGFGNEDICRQILNLLP